MPRSIPRLTRAIPLVLTLLALAACVTERTTGPSTYGLRSSSGTTPRSAETPAADAPALPAGPLSRPITPDASRSSRVRVALLDLGTVPYDGQVLPLVSPDGRFLAVQSGTAPTWPTLLAAPGAAVPVATNVRAYSLPTPAPSGDSPPAAQPLSWPPLTGILLGRSCDNLGFLVEAPQPDGSRWIGYVHWVSGELRWIVQGNQVNAYAALGPDGEFAYSRRGVDSIDAQLVVRPGVNDDREFVASAGQGDKSGAYLWPMFSDEPGIVYAFSIVSGAVELHALKIPRKGDPPVLVIVARHPITRNGSAASIYQMTSAMQVPLPIPRPAAGSDRQVPGAFDNLLFFHVAQRRICVFDRRLGSISPLPSGSVACVPLLDDGTNAVDPGFLVTSKEGLQFLPWPENGRFQAVSGPDGAGASVVKGAYVPRLTTDSEWPVVLLGPAPAASGPGIHLFRLRLEGADVSAARGG